jgi:hypothetical protein
MLRQLKLQDRLVAMAAIPILVAAVVAAGLLLFLDGGGTTPYGIFALCGVVVSIAAAAVIGSSIRSSISEMATAADELADAHRKLVAGEIAATDLPRLAVDGEDDLAEARPCSTVRLSISTGSKAQKKIRIVSASSLRSTTWRPACGETLRASRSWPKLILAAAEVARSKSVTFFELPWVKWKTTRASNSLRSVKDRSTPVPPWTWPTWLPS